MASVDLRLQEPSASENYLLETLLGACEGSLAGGGLFSFATVAGVHLLMENQAFSRFLADAEIFDVVGVDAITDLRTLDALAAVDAPALRARAFLNDRRPVLFHPKLAWFRRSDGITLVTGSGNLTRGGLRSNWEAFNVVDVGEPEAAVLFEEITNWLDRWDGLLLPLDDPTVRERAGRNTGRERDIQVPAPDDVSRELEQEEVRTYEPGEAVFIAELSKSRGGAEQANIHLKHYQGYFGARKGTHRHHIILRQVLPDGTLGEDENRGSVQVASQNYRFELTGLKDREYPEGDLTPIAVFVRTAGGVFIYRVLWPDEPGHAELSALLDQKAGERVGRRRMRHEPGTIDELAAAWPENPLLRAVPNS